MKRFYNMDYELLLEKMIKQQIQARGIKNKKILDAMRKIPRHEFVREKEKEYAYDDCAMPIGEGQTISQPYIVAYMTDFLMPDDDLKILEIGTGSGYQTAILAMLFKEVYTIERIENLQKQAVKVLNKLNLKNINFKIGDGTTGWQENAPYDRIIITGAIPEVPDILKEQLNKKNGIIVAPVGGRYIQKMQRIIYKDNREKIEEGISCVFVPIIGKYGFKE